jgi:hypothetical protein
LLARGVPTAQYAFLATDEGHDPAGSCLPVGSDETRIFLRCLRSESGSYRERGEALRIGVMR